MSHSGNNPEASETNAQRREKQNPAVLKPGDQFGHFRVIKCLCAGLIANYYQMQHIRDLHDVTVCVFHPRTANDTKFSKRLLALKKSLSGLNHEGIPKILDCTEINGLHCLFLEPVRGQSLSQYFGAHGTPGAKGLGTETTTRILAQLLGLLGCAHSHGVDHRDIDSDMIFIQQDGSLRVLGIGVKAALGSELFESIVSASISPLNTEVNPGRLNSFDVISPEFKSGVTEDARVDIYCAGVIAYWLLTAQKPKIANLQLPSTLVEGLPLRWDSFFQNLLERNREERFQSCKMVLLALKTTDDSSGSDRAGFIQRQIDRIPIPRHIVDRGDLAIRIFRLSLLGSIGVTVIALASYLIKISLHQKPIETQNVAQLASPDRPPQLILEVQPPVAKIEFPGYEDSFIINDGRLELSILPGQYQIRASAPHHIEQVESLSIEAKQTEAQSLKLELVRAQADVHIRSEPGALVSVIDSDNLEIELGLTDEEGVFLVKDSLAAGTYQVRVSKNGFQPAILDNQTFRVGEVSVVDAPLTALPASLTIRTNPPGARIRINQQVVGLSPANLDGVVDFGSLQVVAELDHYRTVQKQVKVAPGEDLIVDLGDLVKKSAELQIEPRFVGLSPDEASLLWPDLRLRLGERSYPIDSSELRTVPIGEYQVALEHPLYFTEAITVRLEDGERRPLKFELKPKPGELQLIFPERLEFRVRLNGTEIAVEHETLTVPALEMVEIELLIKDHLNMSKHFELQPTQREIWRVQPVAIPGPSPGEDWVMPYLGFGLAWVPPGRFTMGSPRQEQGRLANEGEPTEVTFGRGFWAGTHEVSQAGFREITGTLPAQFRDDLRPVETVTWVEAMAFCRALTEREQAAGRVPEGYAYRLPTEAEWEYAARAGTTTPFHFGEQADASMGNFRGVYPRESDDGLRVSKTYGTERIGSYAPNALGIFDIHGNVSEWTLDAYNGRLPGGSLTDPAPRTGGSRYTLRGGSWEDFAVRARTAARSDASKDTESNAIGFRIFLAPVK